MKFIRNMIILGVIAGIIFLGIAISGGGDKFRWLGAQIGGVAKVAGDKVAVEADSLRKKALEYKKNVGGLVDRFSDDGKEPDKKK